jgi:hypothetical protein
MCWRMLDVSEDVLMCRRMLNVSEDARCVGGC